MGWYLGLYLFEVYDKSVVTAIKGIVSEENMQFIVKNSTLLS